MEGTEIQAVSEEKDLGVVVDEKLRFSRHIAAACANRKLALLKHTFKYWTEESLVTLFKVFVRPHLEYCMVGNYKNLKGLKRKSKSADKYCSMFSAVYRQKCNQFFFFFMDFIINILN